MVVLDIEGSHDDGCDRVLCVCSTLEKAQAELRDLITFEFMQSTKMYGYESPFHLQHWEIDGARTESYDGNDNEITISQIAKTDPMVEAQLIHRMIIDEYQCCTKK